MALNSYNISLNRRGRRRKKLAAITLASITAMSMMTGCGSLEDRRYVQSVFHSSQSWFSGQLQEGFLAGLEEEGIKEGENLTVMYDNAQTDTGTASTIADKYVSSKVDMICAIATPSAMSAYNSQLNTDRFLKLFIQYLISQCRPPGKRGRYISRQCYRNK